MLPTAIKPASLSNRTIAVIGLASIFALIPAFNSAKAQALSVLPVNIQMSPGQGATTMTVMNHGDSETSVQIRAYAWGQHGGDDELTGSDAVMVSPPLATIPAGGAQVIRIVLRKRPEAQEATYRVVLDQIPPPAQPGSVRVVLRLSIPIFAQPATRTLAHVKFHIEQDGGQAYLVAVNDGGHHEAVRNIVLSTTDGRELKTVSSTPYVLAGATRRWPLATRDFTSAPGSFLRMVAHEDAGLIEQQVQVGGTP